MSSPGFVYVLVNPSIPGCVKVGKTARQPSQRAAELSTATGVATPFLVAYEAYFLDCDAAESYVHALFEKSGVRLAPNREFFCVPPTEAINFVMRAKRDLELGAPAELSTVASAETQSEQPSPWETVLSEATDYYLGWNGKLEDHAKASELFRLAAKLGSSEAFVLLAQLHKGREGFEWLRRGADKGIAECWLELADVYLGESYIFDQTDRSDPNALKCYKSFFATVQPTQFDPSGDRLFALLKRALHLRDVVTYSLGDSDKGLTDFVKSFRQIMSDLDDPAEARAKLRAIDELWERQYLKVQPV